jgi:hypothetical protein
MLMSLPLPSFQKKGFRFGERANVGEMPYLFHNIRRVTAPLPIGIEISIARVVQMFLNFGFVDFQQMAADFIAASSSLLMPRHQYRCKTIRGANASGYWPRRRWIST